MPPPPSGLRQSPRRARRRVALAILTWLVVSAVVLVRLADQPMQPYGGGSAHYIEHVQRLDTLRALQVAGGTHWHDTLDAIDDEFPPLMHVVTAAASLITGPKAERVVPTSLLWLALLGLAAGFVFERLSGRPGVGAVTATALFLTPGLHGFATRYYYDIPMTALLWVAVAVGVGLWPRRPVLGTVGAAFASLAVGLLKWAALAFGPGMMLGAALSLDLPLRRRLALAVGSGLLFLLLLWGFTVVMGPGHSMSAVTGEVITDWTGSPDAAPRLGSPASIERWMGFALAHGHPIRPIFYGARLVGSVFGLGLSLLLLAGLASWARRSRAGLALLVTSVLTHGFFLWFVMPVVDDRFLLPIAPAFVGAAVIGWDRMGSRRRRLLGGAALALGAIMLLDLHLGGPAFLQTVVAEVPGKPAMLVPSTPLRLLAVEDSIEQRGWAHRDRVPDEQAALRARIWSEITACGIDAIRIQEDTPLVWPFGDWYWLQYRARLAEVQGGRPIEVREPCSSHVGDEVDMGITVALGGGDDTHECLPASEWRRVHRIELDDRTLVFWGRVHQEACGQAATGPQRCLAPETCEDGYRRFLRTAEPGPQVWKQEELEQLEAETRDADPGAMPTNLDAGAISSALGGQQLLDAVSLVVPVGVLDEEPWPGGTRMRLSIEDPLLGTSEATLLLPDGPGPHPAVVVHPGHRERADWHIDNRFGAGFPAAGIAALVLEPRVHGADERAARLSADLLAHGHPLLGLRVREVLAAVTWLRSRSDIDPARIGLAGHSGGSAVNNVAWRLDPALAALATDMDSQYGAPEEGGWSDDTVPGLMPLAGALGSFDDERVLDAEYGYPGVVVRDFFAARFGRPSPPGGLRTCLTVPTCGAPWLGALDRIEQQRLPRSPDVEPEIAEPLGLHRLPRSLFGSGGELVELPGTERVRPVQIADPIVGLIPATLYLPATFGPTAHGVVVLGGRGDEERAARSARELSDEGFVALTVTARAHAGDAFERELADALRARGTSLAGLRAYEAVSAGQALLGLPGAATELSPALLAVGLCAGADAAALAAELDEDAFAAIAAEWEGCPQGHPDAREHPGTDGFWRALDSQRGDPVPLRRGGPSDSTADIAAWLRSELAVRAPETPSVRGPESP